MRTPLFLAAVVALMAGQALAGNFAIRGDVVTGPWFSPYGAAFPPPFAYDAFGRCLSPLNCQDYEQMRRFLDRYERNYGQRFAPAPPALVAPVLPRDVPPTPEAHIQPRYRGASQIRPEFEQIGKEVDPTSGVGK